MECACCELVRETVVNNSFRSVAAFRNDLLYADYDTVQTTITL